MKYWNQTDLAEACEIRGTTLSHILNGKTQPDLDTLITLAKVLGVSLATLLMDDDEAEAYAEFQKSRATLKESNAFEDRLNRLLEQRADEMKAEWIAMQRRRALEEMKEPEKADPPEPEVALRKRKHGR